MENVKRIKGNKTTVDNERTVFDKSEQPAITNYIINPDISPVPLISEEDVKIAKNFVDSNHK